MTLNQYCIKAFASNSLDGNPAAVVIDTAGLHTEVMQRIAFINGFPETVFLQQLAEAEPAYRILWFTPQREVENAGHATLAAQHVVFSELHPQAAALRLYWNSGSSMVARIDAASLRFDLPGEPSPCELAEYGLRTVPGSRGSYLAGKDLVVLMETEAQVRTYSPELQALRELPLRGLCVTAPGQAADYCNRFFAPAFGVDEDFVTASVHAYLAPFWGRRLGKSSLRGLQCSPSPGVVLAQIADRVVLSGNCHMFARSVIYL